MITKAKTYLVVAIVVTFVGGVSGYAYYETRDILAGPQITISTPKNGATLDDSLIRIAGKAQNIATITLNDRSIFIDESGAIEEDILLSYGYNIITFRAEDRFGRETTETLELVYK